MRVLLNADMESSTGEGEDIVQAGIKDNINIFMRNLSINCLYMLPITKKFLSLSRQFLYLKSFTFLLWQVMQIATQFAISEICNMQFQKFSDCSGEN